MKVDQGSCACLKVVYSAAEAGSGKYRERWVCEACGSEFKRAARSQDSPQEKNGVVPEDRNEVCGGRCDRGPCEQLPFDQGVVRPHAERTTPPPKFPSASKFTATHLGGSGHHSSIEYNIYMRRIDVACQCGEVYHVPIDRVDGKTETMCPADCGRGVVVSK